MIAIVDPIKNSYYPRKRISRKGGTGNALAQLVARQGSAELARLHVQASSVIKLPQSDTTVNPSEASVKRPNRARSQEPKTKDPQHSALSPLTASLQCLFTKPLLRTFCKSILEKNGRAALVGNSSVVQGATLPAN